jgi:hypothetical protein
MLLELEEYVAINAAVAAMIFGLTLIGLAI